MAGPPFSKDGTLGTDYLGSDVLSRVMYGGRAILVIALLGTLLGMVLGIAIGVVAAYAGGWWDEIIMRSTTSSCRSPRSCWRCSCSPPCSSPRRWILIVLVGVSHAPRVARLARGVALGIVSRDFVIAAEALGEKRSRVILAEVLPNMNAPLLAEGGLRLTYSIGLVGSLGFLGFSANPGAANWGQMIQENRLALATQPWAVLAPVIVIAIFCHRHQPDGRRHRPGRPARRQLMTATTRARRQEQAGRRSGRRGPRRDAHRQARRRRRRHRPGPQARRGRRAGGRVRLGQDHGRYLAARLLPRGRDHLVGQGAARGPRRPLDALARGASGPRRGDRLRPAGPGLRAQPEHPDRQADRRAARAARHRDVGVAAAGRA